jgi:hypothetical protein
MWIYRDNGDIEVRLTSNKGIILFILEEQNNKENRKKIFKN